MYIMTLHKFKMITKPFWVPAITGIYLLLAESVDPLIITALSFGYVGDLLLMRNKKSWFISGALAFLIGHLFYITYFVLDAGGLYIFREHPLFCVIALIPYFIYAVFLKRLLGKNIRSVFLPAVLYVSVLLLMSYTSLLRIWNVNTTSFILTFSGSILFIISDSLISIRKLKRQFHGVGTMIVFTYIAAQILIVIGLTAG